jgi:phage recombination protein Bet
MTQAQTIVPVNEVGNPASNGTEIVPHLNPPRLPYHPAIQERFGIDRASWKALVEAIFPNATTVESVVLALSYCRARKLDPFKRNVHIVPIWNKDLQRMVDTVWPGIGELRTTAFRTGEYAGRSEAVFGPTIEEKVGTVEMKYPEWCQVTVYRVVKGEKREFAGPKVHWLETYATRKRDDFSPNEMWGNRPFGQIEKCAEAAALRAGFPEEVGSDYIAEEVHTANRMAPPRELIENPPAGTDALVQRLEAAREKAAENTTTPQVASPGAAPAGGDESGTSGAGSAPAKDDGFVASLGDFGKPAAPEPTTRKRGK